MKENIKKTVGKGDKKEHRKYKPKKMTPKERLFVREYLVDLNGSAAVRRAGYQVKNPDITYCNLMAKSKIANAIHKAVADREKRLEITGDMVVKELALLGFQNAQNLFDRETGRLIPIHKLPESVGKTIASIEVVTGRDDNGEIEHTTKLRTWDKKGSLDSLGKHLKLFTDRIENSGPDGGPMEVKITNCPPDTDDLDKWLENKTKIDQAYAKNLLGTTNGAAGSGSNVPG